MAYQEDIEVLQDFNEERDLYDRPEEPNKSKTDLKKKLKSKPVKNGRTRRNQNALKESLKPQKLFKP